jgi:hypothetical protein
VDTADFALVRAAFLDFTERTKLTSADEKPSGRIEAQEALEALGLGGLRRDTPPAATAEQCGLLAEDHGAQPVPSSFLGTVLLAPELLRLVRLAGEPAAAPGRTPTVALARNLRFPDAEPVHPGDLAGWDCQGADGALCLAPDGTVTWFGLGEPVGNPDLCREVRELDAGTPGVELGRLERDAAQQWQAFALTMVASELAGAVRSFVAQAAESAGGSADQQLLARATALVEKCTTDARHASWSLDNEPDGALHAARQAKAEAGTSSMDAIAAGMQIFGEVAQTWEHVAHLYLRKAQAGAMALATTTDLLLSLAGLGA